MNLFADPEIVNARKLLCNSCENKGSTFGVEVCKLCGCVIAAKSTIRSAECPIGKWKEIPTDEIPNNAIKYID